VIASIARDFLRERAFPRTLFSSSTGAGEPMFGRKLGAAVDDFQNAWMRFPRPQERAL